MARLDTLYGSAVHGLSERLHRWWDEAVSIAPWPHSTSSAEDAQSSPDIDAIRSAMHLAVAPCSPRHRAQALQQIARAGSVVELWLLRSSLYQYIAQDLGEAEAVQRVGDLLTLFKGAVPGTVHQPGKFDNRAHGQHLQ
jgi:hypothetical protein